MTALSRRKSASVTQSSRKPVDQLESSYQLQNEPAATASNGRRRPCQLRRLRHSRSMNSTPATVLSFAYTAAKLQARLAKAKKAHDELICAAYRAQGDALNIEARAKRRLADEYDAAQARGEVARLGDNLPRVTTRNASKPTAADVGISRQEFHEARQIRDAEKRHRGAPQGRINRGKPPRENSSRQSRV
ncbi:hypothetical protein IVA93_30695 [Bradyrhizobium sp. 155]|nr:hypothetical protein IVA93_30695 [Bradyrhizobium sp. 155]